MKPVAVMGGGALGMLLAGRLAAAEIPVVLWTRTREQAELINRHGLTIDEASGEGKFVVRIEAAAFEDVPAGFSGILLVALKQTFMDEPTLRELSRRLAAEAELLFYQNGIGHLERMEGVMPGRRLLAAVTTEGALRTGSGSVCHTGKGETWIGEWKAESSALEGRRPDSLLSTLEITLKKAGFSVFVSNQIRERMLRKLLINAVINPLTALWRVPNGELAATPERKAAVEALFQETVDILRAHGLHDEPESELRKLVPQVCAATAGNRSSMLQDVLAGRETEIDALNGAVCRLAAASGREAPWNTAVTALVKAILSPKERGV